MLAPCRAVLGLGVAELAAVFEIGGPDFPGVVERLLPAARQAGAPGVDLVPMRQQPHGGGAVVLVEEDEPGVAQELAHHPAIVRRVEAAVGFLLGVVGSDGERHRDVPPAGPGQLGLLRCGVNRHGHAN